MMRPAPYGREPRIKTSHPLFNEIRGVVYTIMTLWTTISHVDESVAIRAGFTREEPDPASLAFEHESPHVQTNVYSDD